jgi:class 3 adenylate cyclase
MRPGPTRYAELDGFQIAYQVTEGGGSIDVVYMIGQGTAFELWWDFPPFARIFERLASFGRLILFDRRGSGFSDRPPPERFPSWEMFAEDLRVVLDAAGSQRAAILGAFDGGPVAMNFAASSPDRVAALMLWNTYARWSATDDYPIGAPKDAGDQMIALARRLWGTEDMAKAIAPSDADDSRAMHWLARSFRASQTPRAYAEETERQMLVDARAALPLITAPTLVMRRRDYTFAPAELSLYLAQHIQGARYLEFPGADAGIWGEDADDILAAIEELVTGAKPRRRADRVLATVLFTDIVDSTKRAEEMGDARWRELLTLHDQTARSVVEEWGGVMIKTTGDGILSRFDGPGRGVSCAQELLEALRGRGIDVRLGLHVGEVELREDGDIGGIAVHIAARVMAIAGKNEIVCSRTVKDLTAGSDIAFEDRGTHVLKGIEEAWQLYLVR